MATTQSPNINKKTDYQSPCVQRIASISVYCDHSPGPGFTWAGGAQSRGGGGVAQHSLRLRQQRPAPASTLWPVWAEWRGRTLPLLQLLRGSSSSPSPVCEVWCHQHWLQLQSVVIITEWGAGMCWLCWSRYFTFCWYTLSTVDCRHLHRLNFLPMFRVSSISLTPQQYTTAYNSFVNIFSFWSLP